MSSSIYQDHPFSILHNTLLCISGYSGRVGPPLHRKLPLCQSWIGNNFTAWYIHNKLLVFNTMTMNESRVMYNYQPLTLTELKSEATEESFLIIRVPNCAGCVSLAISYAMPGRDTVKLTNCTKVCRSTKLGLATAKQPENADTVKSLRISCFLQFPHGLNQFLNINNKHNLLLKLERCQRAVNPLVTVPMLSIIVYAYSLSGWLSSPNLATTSGRFPV